MEQVRRKRRRCNIDGLVICRVIYKSFLAISTRKLACLLSVQANNLGFNPGGVWLDNADLSCEYLVANSSCMLGFNLALRSW